MMKNILTIFLTVLTFFSHGQIATIDISNPAPRISDGIEISVSFENEKMDKIKFPVSGDEFLLQLENQLGNAEINIRKHLLDTGLVKIGPFKFTINSNDFTTDEITIKVYPDLPETNDGIWLRLVKFKDEEFLILEQKISHSWDAEKSGHQSMTINSEGVNFAFLDTYKVFDRGIELEKELSKTSSDRANTGFGSGIVSYRLTKYKIRRLDEFKGGLRITKDMFSNYPKDIEFLNVVIE